MIDKFSAAQRQLDCAIRLFIDEEDSLSIHTLAFASFKVLYDLTKGEDIDLIIRKFGWKLAKIPNFLKHADTDPHAILGYHGESYCMNTIGLATCLYFYQFKKRTPEMWAFHWHLKILHPEEFNLPKDADGGVEVLYKMGCTVIKSDNMVKKFLLRGLLEFAENHPEVLSR